MENENLPINLFVPTFRIDEILLEIRQCLEKGWTGLGYKTIEFEKAWCNYTGLPFSHFLNSATAGLHLALKIFKENESWSDEDEIITTPITFISTNHVILYENLRPVFADIDEYLCISPKSLLEKISPKTRAVIFVGIGGNVGRLKEIAVICKEKGLKLILDAAHMSGTRWLDGVHVGKEADVTVFSYQAVKNLATADSGMICFANRFYDQEVRKWTWLGINKDTYTRTESDNSYKWHYDVEHIGFKYHGNSIMAAMGLVGLKYLEQDNAYRRQLAKWYELFLKNEIEIVPMNNEAESSRHLFQVLVDKRDEVMLALNKLNIFPGVHYNTNMDYRMYKRDKKLFPIATSVSQKVISLPLHLRLNIADVQRVSVSLVNIVNKLK